MGTLLIYISKMATPGRLQFSYVKFCVTRHQFHVFQTFLQTLKTKKGFVASDFHLVQEPRIFNCFH
jgi:hypothetical protein